MKRKIIITADGSKTIQIEDWNEQYHSKHGAIQEAYHVFLKEGLFHFAKCSGTKSIAILELGFGTGLNAFISCLEAAKRELFIDYTGIDAYPVGIEEIKQLNYARLIDESSSDIFMKLHDTPWGSKQTINEHFKLTKREEHFSDIHDVSRFDLIYFDAFGARVQPELWTEDIFRNMFQTLKKNGVLVTYSAKGSVRRAMQTVGFTVERLPGPPGKRHMLRATK